MDAKVGRVAWTADRGSRSPLIDMNLTLARIRHITDAAAVTGEAVLVNYPVRLWAKEMAWHDALAQDVHVLVDGHEPDDASALPRMYLSMSDFFITHYGPLLEDVFAERRRALRAGTDRIDSHIPLVHRTPDLFDYYREVLRAVDDFSVTVDLTTLKRPPELDALTDWTLSELTAQYYGAAPTPWAGPF